MNPLFQMMNMQPNGGNNNFLARFQQFRNTFQGDPKQKVEELLRSGKISQAQYDNAVRMANQFRSIL